MEEDVYSKIHKAVDGKPRMIIALLSEIVHQKYDILEDSSRLSISVQDVEESWKRIETMHKLHEIRIQQLRKMIIQESGGEKE